MHIIYLPETSGAFYPHYFLGALEKFSNKSDYILVSSDSELQKIQAKWNMVVQLPTIYHLEHNKISPAKSIANETINKILLSKKDLIFKHKPKIILDMGIECFFARDELFFGLHQLAKELKIPCSNFVILESGLDTSSKYEIFCAKQDINDSAQFVHCSPGARQFCESYLDVEAQKKEVESDVSINSLKSKTKLFVGLNGRIREHRTLLCLFLFAKGYLSRSYISLMLYDSDRLVDGVQDRALNELLVKLDMVDELSAYVEPFLKMLPLELDVTSKAVVDPDFYMKKMVLNLASREYFDDAIFNLVTETLFFDDNAFLITEKSFKAFASNNPFVLFAHCNTLKHMKSLGFTTYEGFVDEAYDAVVDNIDRIKCCLSEVDRLGHLGSNELSDLLSHSDSVYEKNQDFLKNRLWNTLKLDFLKNVLGAFVGSDLKN